MQEPRPVKTHELSTVISFLNQELRPNFLWSIEDEYPLAISPNNRENIFIVESQGAIVSHALLRYLIIKTPFGLVKVAAIGSVVTGEKYRNKGFSQQVMKKCLKKADSDGCHMAILWTDLYDFYRKLGFELVGTEKSYLIDHPLTTEDVPDLKFIKGRQVAAEAILKIYSQHTVSSIRTLDEIRKYLQIPNSNIYTAWDKAGKIKAYAVEGKGADLTGYIHEWGGGLSNLLPLINFIHKDQQKPLTLIASHHNIGLIRKMKDLGLAPHNGYLGMIKLLNCEKMFKKICEYVSATTKSNFVLKKHEDEYIFGVDSDLYRTQSEQDITKLIFGPERANALHKFNPKTSEVIEKAFPLHFWVWGWDSV